MQVLGGLIELPNSGDLPLPWWHRASLGLIHETNAYVGLFAKKQRPVGDLMVSVLEPHNWSRLIRTSCRAAESRGVLNRIFGAVDDLNIALAEAVTLESGLVHHVDFVLEPPTGVTYNVSERMKEVEKKLTAACGEAVSPTSILVNDYPQSPDIIWSRNEYVRHGWLSSKQSWRDRMECIFGEEACNQVDLTTAVVSADTELRVLRYVFPRKGARTISIHHADIPGALKSITEAISDLNLNILSALLRRGGGPSSICDTDRSMRT